MGYWGLGFLTLVFLEGAVFFAALPALGFFRIFLLWLLAAVAGGAVIRLQGMSMLLQARAAMERGRLDPRNLLADISVVVAGFLLIMPGFLSDALALAILLPRLLNRQPKNTMPPAAPRNQPGPYAHDNTVIDAEYTVIEERDAPKP